MISYQHGNRTTKNKGAEAEEDPDEPLYIVTEIDTLKCLYIVINKLLNKPILQLFNKPIRKDSITFAT